MANGPAFADAVQKLKDLPQLSVGCHVVLIDGEALLAVEQVRSLTTTRGQTSRFRDGLKSFAVRALSGKLNPSEIAAEVSAQIRKLQIAGVAVSHIDTHKHTHLFPAVLRPLLRAAQECGVHAIRNPFGP